MYDRYSLSRLLRQTSFVSIKICSPDQSFIPDWEKYHLDTESDGRVYKPNSLFIEARK